jgi:hypothetical protein
MNKRNKKFVTQEIFNAINSSSSVGKTKQVAIDLSANGRKKIIVEAALDDMAPSEKAREFIGLKVETRKAQPKLILRFSEEDYLFLADKYGIDPEDKLTIRDRVSDEITAQYPDEEFKLVH